MFALSSSPHRFRRVVLAVLAVALAIALFAAVQGRGAAQSAAPGISLDNHPVDFPRDI